MPLSNRALNSSHLVQACLGLLATALVVASVATYAMIRERQQSLQAPVGYNLAYYANQLTIELARLENALVRFENERDDAQRAEVQFRYDILYNLADMLDKGQLFAFVSDLPGHLDTMARLKDDVRGLEPHLAFAASDIEVGALVETLQRLQAETVGLAADAVNAKAARADAERETITRLFDRFSTLAFWLIACGLGFVGVLMLHNQLLRRAHRRLSTTTHDLRLAASDLSAASEAVAAANGELQEHNRRLIEKEDALHARNSLFNAALNSMSQGLCIFGDDLRPLVCNTQFERLFGLPPSTCAEVAAGGAEPPSLRDVMPELATEIEENVVRRHSAEFEIECEDRRIIAVAQRPMPEGGWVATFADVTEQRLAQARIAHMARHDGLTNLPNRYAFREHIQEMLDVRRADDSMLAVMCLDVDQFKEVNDTLGHPTGDALLCAVAERLADCVRDTDMVARFGGDEFAVLQTQIERYDDAERLACRLVEVMRRPFMVSGELVYTTGSVGVAIAPKHGDDPVKLLKNADLALYAAKAAGRRTYRLFESTMDEQVASRHVLERDLRRAIAAGQFHVNYQPIVHLQTMRTTGFEALLRWIHPVHGAVSPAKFIPVAEDAGLITEIGRWVLAQACADAARWPAHLKLSVNLSPVQFAHGDIVQDIRAALSRAGLRPERLIVEITESLLLTESIATLDTLHRLKSLGIEVAMDDFGTGYSSLSYLRKYPFDRIKIDRDFVNSAGQGDTGAAIVQTIVQLGAALGMTTVAEGIETRESLETLLAAGCPEGQGYLFSEARPASRVLEMIGAEQSAEQSATRRVA